MNQKLIVTKSTIALVSLSLVIRRYPFLRANQNEGKTIKHKTKAWNSRKQATKQTVKRYNETSKTPTPSQKPET
jgi:hypothetical protein